MSGPHSFLDGVQSTASRDSPKALLPKRGLRMRFPCLAPTHLVEFFRAAPWNRQRVPLLSCVDSGDLHDLADVVASVAQRALQGQRHGMRFATNHDHLAKVFWIVDRILSLTDQSRP